MSLPSPLPFRLEKDALRKPVSFHEGTLFLANRFKFILGSNKPATGEVLQALLDATTAAFTPKVKAEMARGRLADQRAVLEAVGAPSAGEVALKCEEPVTTAGAFQVCLRFKETRPEVRVAHVAQASPSPHSLPSPPKEVCTCPPRATHGMPSGMIKPARCLQITSYWPASERAFIMPSAIRIQAAAASELALDLPETTQFNARNGRGNTVEPACIPLVIRDPFKNISASADGVLIRATIEMEREGEGNSRAEPPRLERSSGTICRVREGRVAFQDLSVVEGSGARDDGRRLGCVLRFTAECADGMDIRPLEVPLSFVDVAGPGKKLQDLQKACNAANHHLRAASREASAANSIAQELGEQLQPLHGKARLSMLRLAKELDSARIPLPKGFLDFSTTTPDLSTPGGVELLAESVELVAEEVEPGTGFSRMRCGVAGGSPVPSWVGLMRYCNCVHPVA